MDYEPKHFTITDPRDFDGDPYEVAERAVLQVEGLLGLVQQQLDAAERMARNAEMERDINATGTCDAKSWPETPQGNLWARSHSSLADLRKRLQVLRMAAAYNPRKPQK